MPFNPYIVGNPIKTKEMFFGREDDFQFVIRKLGEGRSNQILIFCGDRRSGKTSILFQILLGRLGEEFLPILIDMQILAGIKTDNDFYKAILDVAFSQLDLPDFTFQTIKEKSREKNMEGIFKEFVSSIDAKFPGKILLFLLDEYELIETKIKDGSLSEHVIHFLAGILESRFRVSFIFTGSTNLENRKVEYWKILLGKSIYRKISYLSQNDTARLITDPLKDHITYPLNVIQSIYRLTGGQPFYTQVICQNIVDLLIEEERNDPNKEDLKTISRDIVNNPLPQMIYSWNNLKDYIRFILSALSGVLEGSGGWADAQEVYDFLKKNKIQLPFKKGRINILLEEAYHTEFLEKNDQELYRFRMDIFRQWIKKEHSIWKVIKEIGLELKKPFNMILVTLLSGLSVIAVVVVWSIILSGLTRHEDDSGAIISPQETVQSEISEVKNIVFTSNYGPFRIITMVNDNTLSFSSEGLPDEKKITIPSLEKGEYTFEFIHISSKAKSIQTIEISNENRNIPVEFSAEIVKGTREPDHTPFVTEMLTGSIILSSVPANARIFLNGEDINQSTPAILSDIKLGEYVIEIILEGYRTEKLTISLADKDPVKREVILTKVYGSLILKIRPTTNVYFNNVEKIIKEDTTIYPIETPRAKPLLIQSGTHILTVKNESMNFEHNITVEIFENTITTINWDIVKEENPTITEE
ncbi:MAG: PEGA domain-containing protein [Spirochaetales bacterium]|nr:PEGA domain-containing protein [Spirochaetales bacterium]